MFSSFTKLLKAFFHVIPVPFLDEIDTLKGFGAAEGNSLSSTF